MEPKPSSQISAEDQRGVVRNAMEIPYFTPGESGPQLSSCEDMNRIIVAPLRALTRPSITFGDTWDVRLCDSGIKFQVGSPQSPNGNGSGGAAMFRLKSVQNDYVTARLWNGASDGPTDIALAKEFWARTTNFTVPIYGVTHTFSFSSGPDSNNVTRNNSDGTNAEDELWMPAYVVNEIVFAAQCTTDVVDGGGNPVTWLMNRSGLWAKPSPLAVTPTTPASASATTSGYTSGLIVADSGFIYVSTGTNTWKRVAIATW